MKIMSSHDLFAFACRESKKHGMLIGISMPDGTGFDDVVKAAPYLNFREHAHIMCDGGGYILSDSEDEILYLYDMTVGDDGPTKLNSYDGPVRVYALTCGPDGKFRNENT